jgi:hypothetical protein
MEFQVLPAANMKMTVFWDVVPSGLIEIYQFSEVYNCLHQQSALTMEAVSTYEMSVSFCQTTQPNIPEEAVIFISIFVIIINNFLGVLSVVAVLVETGTLNLSHGINSVFLLLKQLKSSF